MTNAWFAADGAGLVIATIFAAVNVDMEGPTFFKLDISST